MPSFNRNTKDSIIVLLVIVVVCIVLFPFIDDIVGTSYEPSNITLLLKEKRKAEKRAKNQYYAVPEKKGELFPFDPNTADSTQLLRLGLRPWQVRNIYKYRAKGGRYRQPSDFANLYGLTVEQYRRLLPYIYIKEEQMAADVYGTRSGSNQGQEDYAATNKYGSPSVTKERNIDSTLVKKFPTKIKSGEYVNINKADTTELKRIPGIGSYFAKKIVYKRQQLGGLYSPRQLMEIENFPEATLAYMTVGQKTSSGLPQGVSAIKINKLDPRALSRHPYIKYVQAKQIDEYRRMRGNLKSIDDLYRIPSLTPQEIQRLAPYLDFE